ncbi:DTW domain-containing protein [Shewanella olleyana]|uniref:tRNA-uridine aminocarboxypropyltransferase n=1 Tax=Shewanella olleyana TaxID=135626 RepID=UPI00200F5646|nr:tRNA-uridine aminocarboxypropyltransferase [Shewanella olleyana]MCL1066433.1 DTW domain-containing protein [Shewanella olleyana]
MKIILLTHQKETTRPNNTGRWVKQVLDEDAWVIEWDRVNPNKALIELITTSRVGLLYPETETETETETENNSGNSKVAGNNKAVSEFEALIIIDSTWQEARKIYNRSPYLKMLKKVSINNSAESIYKLRRNQREGGLCTAECAAYVLKQCGDLQYAESIMDLLRLQISVTN